MNSMINLGSTASKVAALSIAGMMLSNLATAGHDMEPKNTIVETAAAAGQFETLIAAAQAAGLVGVWGQFT